MSLLSEMDPDVAYPATPRETPLSGLHALARYLAYGALRGHYAERRGCYAGENRNLYYRRGDNKTRVAPDIFVCLGAYAESVETAASYRLWEVGPPAWVLEIASEGTFERDREDKPGIYLEVGAGEYWRFDPTGGGLLDPALQGDRLAGGTWETIEIVPDEASRLRGFSRSLGLELCAEGHRLRFRDPRTDEWLADPDDARARAAAAENQAAAAETARSEEAAARRSAEARAAAAEAEAAALRARLEDRDGDTPR